MNDILNFKSITTYRLKLPLKFSFKTAKGEVKERETIVIRTEDQQGYVGYFARWRVHSYGTHRCL